MDLGIRFVLFLQGCALKCKYCQNRDTWDLRSGKYQTIDEIYDKIVRYKNYIKNGGVTCTGGEPLLQYNFLIELFKLTGLDKSATITKQDFNKYDKFRGIL